ncbi:MAG: preprotein translocase subunit SecG [Roseitalea sp.]|jgi:preprotein translocase subunit SecG|nr:preprotein translocase subunit SecG [Roseitalea sp.]MBO6950624.1 preprotein translocase subunit SecG [Rhizobiaceae bacterium]RNC95020.1 MAG: preprotein translocase subunit SecG [Oricola sp.]MBO6591389.1 preprotein translocase subunit SecG [Roseitalea sp.]MBO6599244.1 preprotein translocase subunit SecG [Roseitalea sp.]
MQTILIVIHLMIVIALVGVVLLQRSEGGGLGIGGGNNAMSARGQANPLTRLTVILGAAFFVTSVSLGLLGRYGTDPTDVLDRIPAIGESIDAETGEPVPGEGGVLDLLGGESPSSDVPSGSEVPAGGVPTGGGTSGGVPNN